MPSKPTTSALPLLPRGWTKIVRSAVVQAISVASLALTHAWSRAATASSPRRRLQAQLDRLRTEVALLREELEIKDARLNRVPPRKRPHYEPVQRMRILELKAARSWSRKQTADRFLLTEETIASWNRRIDEEGENALIQTPEPVNKYPAFVAHLVQWLKAHYPSLGKVRIAETLARAMITADQTAIEASDTPASRGSPMASGPSAEANTMRAVPSARIAPRCSVP